MAQQLEFANH